MKRITLLGVLSGVIILGSLSCDVFGGDNKVEYPITMICHEIPGNPITFQLSILFTDETWDTSGIELETERRGDTLWYHLEGKWSRETDWKEYHNTEYVNFGSLEEGEYTMLAEGRNGKQDTLSLTVEDSLYHLVGDSGDVIHHIEMELRRIFPDMLHVQVGMINSLPQDKYIDSLKLALVDLGAVECKPSPGQYSFFSADVGGVGSNLRLQWDDAFGEWWDHGETMLFTYNGDTTDLSGVFEDYRLEFQALCFFMGNGFNRLYQIWDSY